jgi:hypothetical protein
MKAACAFLCGDIDEGLGLLPVASQKYLECVQPLANISVPGFYRIVSADFALGIRYPVIGPNRRVRIFTRLGNFGIQQTPYCSYMRAAYIQNTLWVEGVEVRPELAFRGSQG